MLIINLKILIFFIVSNIISFMLIYITFKIFFILFYFMSHELNKYKIFIVSYFLSQQILFVKTITKYYLKKYKNKTNQ